MILDRVTITGADDSIQPSQLIDLSKEFPFVEWAILFSKKHSNSPRWPSMHWLVRMMQARMESDDPRKIKLAAHLCGGFVRDVLAGDISFRALHPVLFPHFDRIQLNFHAEHHQFDSTRMIGAMEMFNPPHTHPLQWIFQIDGVNDQIFEQARESNSLDVVPLFDGSHGAGRLPGSWPKADYVHVSPGPDGGGDQITVYHGYAGGLGPDSLEEELPKIRQAAGEARIWIDMESRVRSDGDRVFDLAKVRRCLEICAPVVRAGAF